MQKDYTKIEDKEFDPELEEKRDDNMYKYHDNTQMFDPKTQPYSFFYVTITGQIEFGDFLELDGLGIKYDFIAGSDW